jgi:hypothetical protein
MKRHRIVVISLVVGGLALAGFSGAALAQAPLEPVQHVYPDSPYGEIQQAIDNGGTVYFERLTDKTRQPADYNQVASRTPDLPPKTSLDAKEMGFFIGRNGKDVDIIGVLGPNGERPKINGGTLVFRVGTMAGMGVFGLPVNFKIENLELFNPDLSAAGGLYSRVGLELINVIGTRTTINNCKITVTGKEEDAR